MSTWRAIGTGNRVGQRQGWKRLLDLPGARSAENRRLDENETSGDDPSSENQESEAEGRSA